MFKVLVPFYITVILFQICSATPNDLILIAKKRSGFLEQFQSYSDISVSQIEIPTQTSFASFKISAEPFDLSFFGCSLEKVEVYIKKGSIPVLNPDNSLNPKYAQNITTFPLHSLYIWTNKQFNYINITCPDPGIYYIVAFFSYVNPDEIKVKQKGLSQLCTGFINIHTYVSKKETVQYITENYTYPVLKSGNLYKFNVEPNDRELVVNFVQNSGSGRDNVNLKLSRNRLPQNDSISRSVNLKAGITETKFWINDPGDYFLEIDSGETGISFSIRTVPVIVAKSLPASLFKSGTVQKYFEESTGKTEEYISYELVKESGSESFLYTFNINHENENEFMVPIPLNLTSETFSTLQFKLDETIDVGGTFEFSIDFRAPNVGKNIEFNWKQTDQIIIGCLSQEIEIPTLPRHCLHKNGVKTLAPVVINNTVNNSTVLVPYPESGVWYATLKLFCTPCKNCECYRKCSELLLSCVEKCGCNTLETCSKCSRDCKEEIKGECTGCSCENCADSKGACNSSVTFDLSSFPCILGKCGRNGKCQYMVADGYIFSACHCWNKYRGMDCSDDSNVDPFWKTILAQFLLISSNLVMIPCVYLAFKLRFYSECVMYAFVLFFSSFYHACDVSDYKVQFCITTHYSLQFGDFFSALLSIWATLLIISDLNGKIRAVFHVIGAIILAFCTVIDRTGIWIFLLISIPGIAIIVGNWYIKYRKFGRGFVKTAYLKYNFSSGVVVMSLGISIYAFMQTSGNYMYLHSVWHCIVGITVLIILPRPETFPDISTR